MTPADSSSGHSHSGHSHGDHGHGGHGHGHANDQGLKGMVRYLRHAPRMWSSVVNDAVVNRLAPRAGERVIDIGAGMGAGAVVVARSGAAVVAVEPTPFMRRVLTVRRLGQRERANLSVVDGAAEKIPVADGSIDAVMAVNTMHHWVDVDAAVAEIVRVLAPDGRFVLVDEDFENPLHPDHDAFTARHHKGHGGGHGKGGHGAGGHGDGGHGHGEGESDGAGEHHGFTMVDAEEMANRFKAVGYTDVVAAKEVLAGRPVIAVTGGGG